MWMWMWILFEAVWVCFGQCSHLHMGSLDENNIGDAGALDLGAALRVLVNTTLTTLE
jgi:hypothetical protein